MNLDGDISPICLNILPLVSSSLQYAFFFLSFFFFPLNSCSDIFLFLGRLKVVLRAGLLLYKSFLLTSFYYLL